MLEPLEEVMLEVADEVAGAVIEAVSLRRGELMDMTPLGDTGELGWGQSGCVRCGLA